jgi:DNA-binding XRE family transcriptional regulator
MIGAELRAARLNAGDLQKDLARFLGCDVSTIARWEGETTAPRVVALKKKVLTYIRKHRPTTPVPMFQRLSVGDRLIEAVLSCPFCRSWLKSAQERQCPKCQAPLIPPVPSGGSGEGEPSTALAPLTAIQFREELAEAQEKANALTKIIQQAGTSSKVAGKEYLQVEAWRTIAKGYGLTPDIEWTRELEGGGWEARAALLRDDGSIVSHAEAECGSDSDGDWPGKPRFQQRSMAQTRAVSKVCRLELSWVVVLAKTEQGERMFESTPLEEVEGSKMVDDSHRKPLEAGQYYCLIHKGSIWKRSERQVQTNQPPSHKEGELWCNMPNELVSLVKRVQKDTAMSNVELAQLVKDISGVNWRFSQQELPMQYEIAKTLLERSVTGDLGNAEPVKLDEIEPLPEYDENDDDFNDNDFTK